jgi:FG-GAP repeat protein
MNGTTLQSIVDLPALTNVNYRFDAVADYNGDGKPDIVLRNYATGQDAIWIMNGATLSTIVDLPALTNLNWEIAGPK